VKRAIRKVRRWPAESGDLLLRLPGPAAITATSTGIEGEYIQLVGLFEQKSDMRGEGPLVIRVTGIRNPANLFVNRSFALYPQIGKTGVIEEHPIYEHPCILGAHGMHAPDTPVAWDVLSVT
jgi:hypothetical protein